MTNKPLIHKKVNTEGYNFGLNLFRRFTFGADNYSESASKVRIRTIASFGTFQIVRMRSSGANSK